MKNKNKKKSESLVYICTKCNKGMLNNEETKKKHRKKYCK